MKHALLALLIVFACTALADEVVRTETVTASLETDAPVQVSNINGDITVTGWDSEMVEVTYIITADSPEDMDAVDVLVDTEGGLTCEVDVDSELDESVSFSVDFALNVPEGTELDYLVENINGEINLSDASGKAVISLVNGDVTVDQFSGNMTVEVVNGDVTAEKVPEMNSVEIVNGSVALAIDELLSDMNIETVNGTVIVSLETEANVEIETMSGSIDVADTYNFTISEDVVGSSTEFGEGEHSIVISTLNGDIEITE